MFYVNGRISWLLVSTILFSTVVMLLTDVLWRVIQISSLALVAFAVSFLIVGNATILVVNSRSSRKWAPAAQISTERPNP
jgi:hypothetical protein